MKKIIAMQLLLICAYSLCFAQVYEDISEYKLKEYDTVEEFQEAYLNKIISYSPIAQNLRYPQIYPMCEQMNLGPEIKDFIVTSIVGKTKKNKFTQDMVWTIKEVNSDVTRTFKVHTGNYIKDIKYDNRNEEFLFRNLQFFLLDKWKEDHKNEIGILFEDPLVKAKYEVVDVFLDIDKYNYSSYKILQKKYSVKNSVTGQISQYHHSDARIKCFEEDKSGKYISTLSKVEKPSNPSVKYGSTTVIDDDGLTKYSYEDNYINIIIFGDSKQFYYKIKNVSDNSLKIVWDDAVFVGYSGSTSKVMHSGIKYSEREGLQPTSTIIKGASLEDIACPTSNVYFDDTFNIWETKSMYPDIISAETKQVQLMLPIQIKDIINEYIFVFNIQYMFKYPERLNLSEKNN